MKIVNTPGSEQVEEMEGYDVSRRRFFQLAGGIAGAGILLAACKTTPPSNFYVGSGDTGLINYLNVLEQVQSGFYIQAVITPYYGLNVSQSLLLTDTRDQAIAHRDYWAAINGSVNAIPSIVLNLSSITFADQTNVITAAITLADLAVSAYNGVAQLFQNTNYILTAAKIATVQARRSAYMRDLLNANSFASSSAVNSNGLDLLASPPSVMATLQNNYTQTKFDYSKLPTF